VIEVSSLTDPESRCLPATHLKKETDPVSITDKVQNPAIQVGVFVSHITKKQTPCPDSASELCRPSDRRLSAKLVLTFADRRVSRSQRGGSPTAVISISWTGAATFSFKYLLNCTHEAEWTPFQTQYFSEDLVAPGIQPGPLDLKPRTLTTRPQGRS
jgi:hypothetical protein